MTLIKLPQSAISPQCCSYHRHGPGLSHPLSPLLRLSLLACHRTDGGGKRKVRSQSGTEVGTRECYSTVDLIEAAGFPAETHHVTTSDGYILALHRYDASTEGL